MTLYLAFLRGINVGGHNVVKMADLKQAFTELGLGNVQTYIQSGNVLFDAEESVHLLKQRIEKKIKDDFGILVTVILRTASELKRILKECPYNDQELGEGESIHFALLDEMPSVEGISRLNSYASETEKFTVIENTIYLFFQESIRNSKLAAQLQKVGVPATVRNWKTMNKLNALASARE